ncbi:Protein GPR107 [Seminavis robusta]|uniref:Protein GPR107 n=1 Tax=Seminavis robusta TaxID=568900 RepID=A0A9N8DX53_9STRA|nr:Protein GPR107 [Seminavis robusta]|eukprot:Sro411_g137700.1 Protein GPR107 (545) ;mRNA; f:43226-44860
MTIYSRNHNSGGSLLVLLLSPILCSALHHNFYIKNDLRTVIGPVGVPFGFLVDGYYDLQVFDFSLNLDKKKYKAVKGQEDLEPMQVLDNLEAGLLLQRFENEAAFNQYMDELKANSSVCAFEYFLDDDDSYLKSLPGWDDNEEDHKIEGDFTAENGVFLSLKAWQKQKNVGVDSAMRHVHYKFKPGEDGLYFLIYQICPTKASGSSVVPRGVVSTFELDFHFLNFDRWGKQSYLTAGEMNMPMVFFYFFVSYSFCAGWWISNIRKARNDKSPGKPVVYAIHHLMSALLCVKVITVLLESIRYHYIRVVGHAELWSFAYYTFDFLKGTFLFVVILLIGSGWSFAKPFLSGNEKKVILAILILQVINNIALVVLARETEGEARFDGWQAILHLVDIICCCAVLVPIVWQVNQLEKSVIVEDPNHPDYNGNNDNEAAAEGVVPREGDMDMGEKGRILSKLKLFRTFYMMVVAYIYSTRILVYLFATMLSYKHLWIRYFVIEVVTLTFYVVTGFQFRPMADNPYLGVKREDDLGDDDNFINERELEMK